MSHSMGQVQFPDGLVMYFEYNGTSDIEIPNLYQTWEETSKNWRNHPDIECSCGGQDEPVKIATEYGGGFHWEGRACRTCHCLTDGFLTHYGEYDSPPYETEKDGLPSWWRKHE